MLPLRCLTADAEQKQQPQAAPDDTVDDAAGGSDD